MPQACCQRKTCNVALVLGGAGWGRQGIASGMMLDTETIPDARQAHLLLYGTSTIATKSLQRSLGNPLCSYYLCGAKLCKPILMCSYQQLQAACAP